MVDDDAERTADDLAVTACERCPALVESRTRIANGDGPASADLLLLGEAPGEQEDREGRPFVGRAGDVLDDALAQAGLTRDTVRITNSVRCRPPDNRDPHVDELDACRSHLDAEVAAVDPTVVVTLGKVPSEHLLGRDVAVSSEAGSVAEARVGGRSRAVVVSTHPAATFYGAGRREGLDDALAQAVALADVDVGGDDGGGGQSRIGDF